MTPPGLDAWNDRTDDCFCASCGAELGSWAIAMDIKQCRECDPDPYDDDDDDEDDDDDDEDGY